MSMPCETKSIAHESAIRIETVSIRRDWPSVNKLSDRDAERNRLQLASIAPARRHLEKKSRTPEQESGESQRGEKPCENGTARSRAVITNNTNKLYDIIRQPSLTFP